MDPLSLSASIAGLISLAEVIVGKGFSWRGGVRNCRKEVQALQAEIEELRNVLSSFNSSAGDEDDNGEDEDDDENEDDDGSAQEAHGRQRMINGIDKTLTDSCRKLLEEVQLVLDPYTKHSQEKRFRRHKRWLSQEETVLHSSTQRERRNMLRWLSPKFKRVLWPLKKKTVQDLIDSISRYKITFVVAQQQHLISVKDEEHREEVLQWYFSGDTNERHKVIEEERNQDTGDWFFQTDNYKRWCNGTDSWLWCKGDPGAGKTFLMSNVVKRTRTDFDDDKNGIAQVYFSYDGKQTQSMTEVMGSLIQQLGCRKRRLPREIEKLCGKHQYNCSSPYLDELQEVFFAVLKEFKRVWLFFDALDEWGDHERERERLLALMVQLKNPRIKLLVTSRPHADDIANVFGSALTIQVQPPRHDLEIFALSILGQRARLDNISNAEEIASTVAEKAKGMFLLAKFQLEHVISQGTERRRKEALAETMTRVRNQQGGDRDLALRVLVWITAARRPLTVEELRHAVTLEKDADSVDDDLPKTRILRVCKGLVTFSRSSRARSAASLVHYTVKEFFGVPAYRHLLHDLGSPDRLIAEACLTYLSLPEVSRDLGEESRFDFPGALVARLPLLAYASSNWSYHARQSGDEEALCGRAQKVAKSAEALRRIITVTLDQRWPGGYLSSEGAAEVAQHTHLIRAASLWGSSCLLRRALDEDGLESDVHEPMQTALIHAAERGNLEIVKQLVEFDSEPNLSGNQPGGLGTSRHEVYLNRKGYTKRSALTYAVQRGHAHVVEFLVGLKGIDLNSVDLNHSTPLVYAARYGHKPILKMLLSRGGVKVNYNKYRGRTPLMCAAFRGHAAAVKALLLRPDVDLNAADSRGTTALNHAIRFAKKTAAEEIVSALLEKDELEVNIGDGTQSTALMHAVKNRRVKIVELLLARPDINTKIEDRGGSTAVTLAAQTGSSGMLQLLVNRLGLEIQSKDSFGCNPLMYAAQSGCYGAVKILLRCKAFGIKERCSPITPGKRLRFPGGMDRGKGSYGLTALAYAAQKGNKDVAKLLLKEEGVLVNTRTSKGQTPLMLAAMAGSEAVVRLLLKRKQIDINAKDQEARTALIYAALLGRKGRKLVELLLEREDTALDVKDVNGKIALDYARKKSYNKKMVRLLEEGACQKGQIGQSLGRGDVPLFPSFRVDRIEYERTALLKGRHLDLES